MKISREVKTGAVALIVLAITIWGYNFLKGKNILSPTDTYYVAYDNIEGIIESGAVYFKGYKVGNINQIEFDSDNPDKFIITIMLENRMKIPNNSQVMAKQTNPIASAKDLELVFSDEKTFHEPGDTLLPAYDDGLLAIINPLIDQFEDITASINVLLESVNKIVDPDTQDNLKETLASINGITYSLEKQLGPDGNLTASLKNLESITGTLESKKESLGKTLDNMACISTSLDSADIGHTIKTLDSTLAATHEIMAKINESEGTAGLLINDSTLYMNLAASTASLDSLLTDLKDHPKRYVHFSMFGKKDE